jgi:hypothetical protein
VPAGVCLFRLRDSPAGRPVGTGKPERLQSLVHDISADLAAGLVHQLFDLRQIRVNQSGPPLALIDVAPRIAQRHIPFHGLLITADQRCGRMRA